MPSQKPKIAIVGRPNVGKSALFNRIAGRRIAIVDEACGVTRDRLEYDCQLHQKDFQLIDTGGIDPTSQDPFGSFIETQARLAIEEADVLILVVDSLVGITELDLKLARQLLKSQKPLALAANKVDRREKTHEVWAFTKLGIDPIFPISALHGRGVMELLEWATARLPEEKEQELEDNAIRLAIIGRPNVGKSTFINTITHEERCIVSDLAGTTRDAIDCPVTIDEQAFTLVDTAGIRRIPKQKDVVEKFAHIRTERAIERCDIAVLMIDCMQGMTAQEKRIANNIEDKGRGCIIFVNKWDLTKNMRMEHAIYALRQEVPFLRHCPILVGSARQGRNALEVFSYAKKIIDARNTKVPTSRLNQFVEKTIQLNHPPMIRGKRLRIYYLTQTQMDPPTFILFINYKDLLAESWKKYLINQFRKEFGFLGLPVRFIIKDKSDKKSTKQDTAEESTEAHEDL